LNVRLTNGLTSWRGILMSCSQSDDLRYDLVDNFVDCVGTAMQLIAGEAPGARAALKTMLDDRGAMTLALLYLAYAPREEGGGGARQARQGPKEMEHENKATDGIHPLAEEAEADGKYLSEREAAGDTDAIYGGKEDED